MPVVHEHSAGGVLVKDGRVLLIRTQNLRGEEVWTFPKGLVEPGESPREAALREVFEETGYEAEVLGPLGATEYWFVREGRRVKKRVDWFLMRPLKRVKEPDWEVAGVEWVGLEEAARRLRYRSDRALLERVREALGGDR